MTAPELHTLTGSAVTHTGYAVTWACSCGASGRRTTGYPVPNRKLLGMARTAQATHRRTAERRAARS